MGFFVNVTKKIKKLLKLATNVFFCGATKKIKKMPDRATQTPNIATIMNVYHKRTGSDTEQAEGRRVRDLEHWESAQARTVLLPDSDGFVQKRRARITQKTLNFTAPAGSNETLLDFSFENPLHGKFKDLDAVTRLLSTHAGRVKRTSTTYCHFEYEYMKPTVFITTLTDWRLPAACPANPCETVRCGHKHTQRVAECDAATKNSLPPLLVDSLVKAWLQKHTSASASTSASTSESVSASERRFLLIDVFSGFGSVSRRVRETVPDILVFTNDVVDRGQDAVLDMSAGMFHPGTLLALALAKYLPEDTDAIAAHPGGAVGWTKDNNVAVLFHCSTPCRTYSTQALCVHRVAGTPVAASNSARHDDAMNEALLAWFEETIL